MEGKLCPPDIYDEEFFANLELAKNLMEKMPRSSDKNICKKWITKLCSLKSMDPVVKKNRNGFFKYMIQILHKGVDPEGHKGDLQYDDKDKKDGAEESKEFMSRWSADKRTYVAAKPLPGEGALVYMAVSSEPELGWDKQNFSL